MINIYRFNKFITESMTSSLKDNEELLKLIYDKRKNGESEYEIKNHIKSNYGKHYSPTTLYNNADHEDNIAKYKDIYHPPNTWHRNLQDHEIAEVYRRRKNGDADNDIARDLSVEWNKTVKSNDMRYNVDHHQAFRLASSPEFKDTHKIGYTPPNQPKIGGSKPNYELTPKMISKATQLRKQGYNNKQIARQLNIPETSYNSFKGKIDFAINVPKVRVHQRRGEDFHSQLLHLMHNEGLTNKEIIDKLGITKGTLIGYMNRNKLTNPNRGKQANLNKRRKKDTMENTILNRIVNILNEGKSPPGVEARKKAIENIKKSETQEDVDKHLGNIHKILADAHNSLTAMEENADVPLSVKQRAKKIRNTLVKHIDDIVQ